jgi:hypothetical protein
MSYAVVCDLDETLVHYMAGPPETLPEGAGWRPLPRMGGGLVLRPGLAEFLATLVRAFDAIYVFTAGTREYARLVVAEVFGPEPFYEGDHGARPPVFVRHWSREDCVLYEDGTVHKPLFDKRGPNGEPLDTPRVAMVDDRSDITGMDDHTTLFQVHGFRDPFAPHDPARGGGRYPDLWAVGRALEAWVNESQGAALGPPA